MSRVHVKNFQRLLKSKGFYAGRIDGDFGEGTLRAYYESSGGKRELIVPSTVGGLGKVIYQNSKATRNGKCTDNLINKIALSVAAVFGKGYYAVIYSGGQPRKGSGGRRVGSVRHDDFGNGGRAADIYVYGPNHKKVTGLKLAKLGQYWLAKRYGGVGTEMAIGGIHLDEWTKPPRGAGMLWTYPYSDRKYGKSKIKNILIDGLNGVLPNGVS